MVIKKFYLIFCCMKIKIIKVLITELQLKVKNEPSGVESSRVFLAYDTSAWEQYVYFCIN